MKIDLTYTEKRQFLLLTNELIELKTSCGDNVIQEAGIDFENLLDKAYQINQEIGQENMLNTFNLSNLENKEKTQLLVDLVANLELSLEDKVFTRSGVSFNDLLDTANALNYEIEGVK